MSNVHCEGVTKAGNTCQARPVTGTRHCVAHTHDPAMRARVIEGSRRGGQRRGEQLRRVTASPIDVMDLDLETATGLRTYLARALQRLAELPFDVRVVNAMAQVVNVARATIEAGDLEERISALEVKEGIRVA